MKKLNFTDGTFVSMFEDSDVFTGDFTLGIPYALWYPGYNFDITKTDILGNEWRFVSNNEAVGTHFYFNGQQILENYRGNTTYIKFDSENNEIILVKHGGAAPPIIGSDTNENFAGATVNGANVGGYTLAQAIARSSNVSNSGVFTNLLTEDILFTVTIFGHYPNSNTKLIDAITAPLVYAVTNQYSHLISNDVQLIGQLEDLDIVPDSDPYAGAGESDTGGGGGTFDGSSDPVDIPPLPTVGATDAGFITLFAPTPAQLKALATYMWSSAFDIEGGGTAIAFKKLFNDPMDCILGLSVVPVAVPTSGAREITVGNLITTVSMNVASQQYIEVNCGSIPFTDRFFGSYLDYEPYTKMAIFVPYSGVHTVNADDIIGRVVTLVYHIDILTGSLVAFLKCGESVLYEFNGACASNIPVNSLNYASTIENAIRIAVNIGTTVATAGAAAPLTGANAAERMAARTAATTLSTAGSTAEGAISMKPGIDRAGSLGGTTGLMGNQIPYFIITRPRLCKPKNQNFYKGYPSFIQTTLSQLVGQGYTEFDTVILARLYLTDEEKRELLGILMGGVYL